ncbi:WD40 repeat domain-containing protein [Streptomyces sp. PA03-3a]|nr:WD40 repeat domain-containing protein [Streptomyces sp. PA03-3a]
MNADELLRDSLHEQAAGQPPLGPGFAGRVLTARRRRRTRALACAAAATAAVVAIAVAVPLLAADRDHVHVSSGTHPHDILAHPDQTPPRNLIAAGNVALAAYYTWSNVEQTDDRAVTLRNYRLLDQKSGTYVESPEWSFLDVAPGMRTAAVLEKDLPARRIGLLDLFTGKVERWIALDRGVASVAFSPDGGKLVATTYDENPDLRYRADYDSDGDGEKNDWMPQMGQSSRTGFYVLDVNSGKGSWSEVTDVDELNTRQDFAFSHDGKLVYSGLSTEPHMQYYDFAGKKVARPADEAYVHWANAAGLSPDGRLVAGDFAGDDKQTASVLLDPHTGEAVTKVRGQQLLAWADDKRLIAWDITPGSNEFHNRLVLVTIGSDKVVPLSGFRKGNDGAAGRWTPIFAER